MVKPGHDMLAMSSSTYLALDLKHLPNSKDLALLTTVKTYFGDTQKLAYL